MALPPWVKRFDNYNKPLNNESLNNYDQSVVDLHDNPVKYHRSQSLIPQSENSWHDHRRHSLQQPVRWHSDYNTTEKRKVSPRSPTSPLGTIPEDGWNDNFQLKHKQLLNSLSYVDNIHEKPDRHNSLYPLPARSSENLFASSTNTLGSDKSNRRRGINPPSRSRSEPDLVEVTESPVKNKRRKSAVPDRLSVNDFNLDNRSEKSHRSARSEKSHRSARSEKSTASLASTTNNERKKSVSAGDARRQSAPKSDLRRGSAVSNRAPSIISSGSEKNFSTPSPTTTSTQFAKIEIPIELLETPSLRLKKMLGPAIMCILAVTLAGSLGIAVYFATALKDTQEKQIDFLHAHFEMSIRNQNINQLSFRQREVLAVSYCKMMDKFYTGSELKKLYRGCEVISLRNDKINFTLFFTESGSAPEDAIMQVIQDSAPAVNAPGRAEPLVMVDLLKVDLTTAKIKLETKKEPENFSKIIVDNDIAAAKNMLAPNPTNIVELVGDSTAQLTESIETSPTTTSPTSSTTTSFSPTTVSATTVSPTTTTTTTPPTSTSRPALLAEKYVKSTTRSTNYTTTYNKHPTSAEPPNPCEGKNGGFYPHPTECNLYYECQNEVSVLLYCGQVMVFDFNSKVCVMKTADSLCPNITHYVGDISSRHVTDASITLPVYEWNPCANNNGDYFPHPVECNLFFQCDHGKSVLRLCQSGLLYDWKTKVCSRQSDQVVCPDPSKAPPRPEDTFTVAPPSITTKNTSKNLYPTRPVYSRTPCKTSKDGNSIFPHPDDCSLYILCIDGVENKMVCDDDLVFDPEIATCRKPTTELRCPDLTPCKGVDLGYFAHPLDCSKFIICEMEKEVIQSCLHSLVWDPTKKSCTLRTENSICP